jgi:hypothetical protein
MQSQLVWLGFVIIVGIYTSSLWIYSARHLELSEKNVFFVLLGFELVLALLHALDWVNPIYFWGWLFDLDAEKNIPAAFSALQLAIVGGLGMILTFGPDPRKLGTRLHSLGVCLVFMLLAADEYYSLHETWENFEYIYLAIGGTLFLATALVGWLSGEEERSFYLRFLIGLGVMAGGGIGLEIFPRLDLYHLYLEPYDGFVKLQALEEYFEMSGVSFLLLLQLTYIQHHFVDRQWSLIRKLMIAATGFAVLMYISSLWIMPSLESRFLAQSVDIGYLGDSLRLEGYRVSRETLTPTSRRLRLTLYWRATRRLDNHYGVSVHLLAHPDIRSVTQNDVIVSPPHPDWLPNRVMKQVVFLSIPKTLEMGRDYWLTVTIWRWPWWENNRIVVENSDRELVTPDTVVLEDIPASVR